MKPSAIQGDIVKFFRERDGIGQEELAKAVGVTRSTVSRWEAGLSRPGTEKVKRLADTLRVAPDVLAGSLEEAKNAPRTSPEGSLLSVFPGLIRRDYDEDLKGIYRCYSLLLHKPGWVTVSSCTIERSADGFCRFTTRFPMSRPSKRDWDGSGVVSTTSPCAFMIGAHNKGVEPFLIVLLVGPPRGYPADELQGVLTTMSRKGAPSATGIVFKRTSEVAANDKLQNIRIGDIESDVRESLEKAGQIRIF